MLDLLLDLILLTLAEGITLNERGGGDFLHIQLLIEGRCALPMPGFLCRRSRLSSCTLAIWVTGVWNNARPAIAGGQSNTLWVDNRMAVTLPVSLPALKRPGSKAQGGGPRGSAVRNPGYRLGRTQALKGRSRTLRRAASLLQGSHPCPRYPGLRPASRPPPWAMLHRAFSALVHGRCYAAPFAPCIMAGPLSFRPLQATRVIYGAKLNLLSCTQ